MKAFEVPFKALGLSFQRRKTHRREEEPYFFGLDVDGVGLEFCPFRVASLAEWFRPRAASVSALTQQPDGKTRI